MDLKQTITEITRELLQAIHAEKESERKPEVLFIFCDSTAHEPFMDQFIQLQNANIRYDLLFLDGETSAWLNMHRIESSGSGKIIATDEYAPAPIELPKNYDGIVIPEIDLDNAARVVTGMKGSMKAEVIFSALVLGKFVIAGEDVPGLKRSDRRCLKTLALPAPYRALFLKHREEMGRLGITFVPQQALATTIIDQCQTIRATHTSETVKSQSSHGMENAGDGKPLVFPEKLVTANWVRSSARRLVDGKCTLLVNRHCIITPLARDLLHELGVDCKRMEG